MKKIDDRVNRNYWAIFGIMVVVFTVLYLLLVGSNYTWIDESYTFAMMRHSYREIWKITAASEHPPLYYWYVKTLSAPLHHGFAAAQICSIIPYLAIILLGGITFKRLFNARTALLFMLLFFCFPFSLEYSIEVRMYALAAAFVFGCAVFAYKYWLDNKMRDGLLFALCGVGAAYTHYFAFVSIIIVYGLLFLAIVSKKRALAKRYWLFVLISVLAYAPWIPEFYGQLATKVHTSYWIPKITLRTIFGYVKSVFGVRGMLAAAVISALAYFVAFLWVLRKKQMKHRVLCMLCLLVPFGTTAVGVIASIVVRPVFIIRYLIPAIPLLISFMAIVLGEMDNVQVFGGIIAVALVSGICNYGMLFHIEHTYENYVPLSRYEDVDSYIVMDSGMYAATLGYYETEKTIYTNSPAFEGADNPYYNFEQIKDFDMEANDKVILIVKLGQSIPEQFSDYESEYLGEWRCGHEMDAYLLNRK